MAILVQPNTMIPASDLWRRVLARLGAALPASAAVVLLLLRRDHALEAVHEAGGDAGLLRRELHQALKMKWW